LKSKEILFWKDNFFYLAEVLLFNKKVSRRPREDQWSQLRAEHSGFEKALNKMCASFPMTADYFKTEISCLKSAFENAHAFIPKGQNKKRGPRVTWPEDMLVEIIRALEQSKSSRKNLDWIRLFFTMDGEFESWWKREFRKPLPFQLKVIVVDPALPTVWANDLKEACLHNLCGSDLQKRKDLLRTLRNSPPLGRPSKCVLQKIKDP